MSNLLLTGIILGISVAAPMGPVNVAMMRQTLVNRHLLGGVGIGTGACLADLTYLILVSMGILQFLAKPVLLKVIGFLGVLYILYLGLKVLFSNLKLDAASQEKTRSRAKIIEGYLMAFLSPYNIVFWAAVLTSQVASHSHDLQLGLWQIGLGLLMGTFAWVVFFNGLVHYLANRFSQAWMNRINRLSGIILIGFAIYQLIKLVS